MCGAHSFCWQLCNVYPYYSAFVRCCRLEGCAQLCTVCCGIAALTAAALRLIKHCDNMLLRTGGPNSAHLQWQAARRRQGPCILQRQPRRDHSHGAAVARGLLRCALRYSRYMLHTSQSLPLDREDSGGRAELEEWLAWLQQSAADCSGGGIGDSSGNRQQQQEAVEWWTPALRAVGFGGHSRGGTSLWRCMS